jgi:hypothetical protein
VNRSKVVVEDLARIIARAMWLMSDIEAVLFIAIVTLMVALAVAVS